MLTKIGSLMGRFVRDESGTETVEWAIVAGLLIVVVTVAWTNIGGHVNNIITDLAALLDTADTN